MAASVCTGSSSPLELTSCRRAVLPQDSPPRRDVGAGDIMRNSSSSASSLPELPHMTDQERQIILRVLRRDQLLRRHNDIRVLRLKAELQTLRRKGALKASGDPESSSLNSLWSKCGRCRAPLGCLLNRGAECRSCRLRVCKICRQYNDAASDWVCHVCFKQMEIQAASGEWMNEFVRRPSRRRDNRVYVPAADLIKRSIRRSWTISNPQSHPRPLAMSRLSPEMRAYSSLPRRSCNRVTENGTPVVPWSEILEQRRRAAQQQGGGVSPSSSSSSRDRSPDEAPNKEEGGDPEMKESDKKEQTTTTDPEDFEVETLSGTVFRKVTIKKKHKEVPSTTVVPEQTVPPTSVITEEDTSGAVATPSPAAAYLVDYSLDAGKIQPESDDYKLVFINSDSSSKGSNSDVEFTTDDCDWDYFEATPTPPATEKQIVENKPSPTSLLGAGNFSEHTQYERSNYTQAYLNRHFKDRGGPEELPEFYFDRYWSGMYAGGASNSTAEFLRWNTGLQTSRPPCENCGSDAASLLQGLCTGTNLIPVPYPVPVPIPFGAEADLAYLENAIRGLKFRSFQPPPPPHILLQASPFGFNYWQSILRNETCPNSSASWLNTEKAEEKQQAAAPVECAPQAAATSSGGESAADVVSTAVVMATTKITTPVKKSCEVSIQCDMVETDVPQQSDEEIQTDVLITPADSESDSSSSDDETFSQVFVVNPENDDIAVVHSNVASTCTVDDNNDEIIDGGVQLKHIRQLDVSEDPGYASELSEGIRTGQSIDDLNTDTENNLENDNISDSTNIADNSDSDTAPVNLELNSAENLIETEIQDEEINSSTEIMDSELNENSENSSEKINENIDLKNDDETEKSELITSSDIEKTESPTSTEIDQIDENTEIETPVLNSETTISDLNTETTKSDLNIETKILDLSTETTDLKTETSDLNTETQTSELITETNISDINVEKTISDTNIETTISDINNEPEKIETNISDMKTETEILETNTEITIPDAEVENQVSNEENKNIDLDKNQNPEIIISEIKSDDETENMESNTELLNSEKVEENEKNNDNKNSDIKTENTNDITTETASSINTETEIIIVATDCDITHTELHISEDETTSDNTSQENLISQTNTEKNIDNSVEHDEACDTEKSTIKSDVTEVSTTKTILKSQQEEKNSSSCDELCNDDEEANDLSSSDELIKNDHEIEENNSMSKSTTPPNMILHITEDYDLVPLHEDIILSPAAMGAANVSSVGEPSGAVEPESVSESPRNSGGYTSYVMITQDGGNIENTNESDDERVNVSVIEVSEDEVKINHTNSGDELNPCDLISENNSTATGLAGYFTLTLETGVESSSPTPRKPEVKLRKLSAASISSSDQNEESAVQIITGDTTMSHAVLCLEEGLADDDSWVEEVDDVDSSNMSESSGDEAYLDREEELRGYHRAIDFTLHTILEESEDEATPSTSTQLKSQDKTELEKYFFFGLGGSTQIKNDEEISDTQSESSIVSEALQDDDVTDSKQLDPAELASSRLEKYFLTSFLEPPSADALSDNTDESGSVGSDSEGKPSPEQRRKKLVRARGAGRHSERGLDSLAPSDVSGSELPETNDDSTETDSYNDEPNFGIDGLDTVKRKKKKQPSRLSNSTPNISALISSPPPPQAAAEEAQIAAESGSEPEDGAKTPQPDLPADPPPPSRKHHSRDSGFIGSCDDLLRTGPSGSSSGAGSGGSGSDRELETAPAPGETTPTVSPAPPSSPLPALPVEPPPGLTKPSSVPPSRANLARKDSFNNWSSDEETNLMMCKMRAFFKTMVAGGNKNNNNIPPANTNNTTSTATAASPAAVKVKPPQLVYFESELTRLMKTVPGIKDEQVREIVEYLSSEDTWSDSYDSSDYTSSDLEGATFGPRTELQQQISASCQEIIQKFDSSSLSDSNETPPNREDTFVYQRLVASLSRVASNENTVPAASTPVHNSPPIIAKVMHHIGSRLVALMHEVSAAGDPSALLANSGIPSPKPRFRRLQRQQQSPTSSSMDESDSPGGSDTERGSAGRMRRHPSLPRSKSHDLGQWQQLLQDAERRAVPRESLRSSSSGVSDLAEEREDYERFSWRGSFESALAADSRTKLSLEAKRRSTGSGSGSASDLFSSSDQLDRRGRVRSCGSIGSRASLPGRGGTRLSSSGGDLLTAAENEGLLDANSRRRGSVPDAITPRSTTLPRSNPAVSASTNSLPRLPLSASPVVAAIHKSYSAQLHATPSTPPHHSPHHTHHHHFLQNVKSARYRPPNFRPPSLGPPKRAVSAPGLHHTRRTERRRGTPLSGEEGAGGFLDDVAVSSTSLSTPATPQTTPQGTLQTSSTKNGSSPAALNKEWPAAEDDIDRLVAIHQQRSNMSTLGARSDSMASVYSGAGEGRYGTVAVRGEVEFGLQYNYKAGSLEIHVKQCRDLAPVDAKRNRSDPYVKVYLLPDKSKSGKRKTKVKKHTLNPVFDETLKFHMTLHGLETRTLWLTVWHSDMFGRNDFLGEVMMVLENKVFDDPTPNWYPLQERTEPFEDLLCYKGDIIVGLKFVPPDVTATNNSKKNKRSRGALHVLVKEAKNLTAVKASGSSDPFCKSYLLPDKGRGSKQKTSVARRTCNPAWNHTFVYEDVSLQELSERSLELTVWDHDRLASNEFLGGLRFNLGSGKHFGKNVDWMDATGREMTLWQKMLERPNFWVEGSLTLRPSLDLRHSSSTS